MNTTKMSLTTSTRAGGSGCTPPTSTSAPPTSTSAPTTRESTHPARTSPTADRGVLGDVMGFRPSATLGREVFAIAINIVIVLAVAIAVQPPVLACIVGGVIVAVILAARLAAGFATEGYAEQLKGGR